MISHSALETRAFGETLAASLRAGDVVLLSGDMGAGKSELARGIARGLGIAGAVPSPTFTIMNAYEGALPLYHFDLYRIETADELYELGLDEYIGGDCVALIEWHERAPEVIPADHVREVVIRPLADGSRDISVRML